MLRIVIGIICCLAIATGASAISVTSDTDANSLAGALTQFGGSGLTVTSSVLSGHSNSNGASSGTFTNATQTYSALLTSGIVLSTGNVMDYGDGPNQFTDKTTGWGVLETPAQKVLLDPITLATSHWDVTQLDITFDMQPGFDTAYFNMVFGSEEHPEFIGSNYIDGFGLFVNGSNIAFVDGLPVNINHPNMAAVPGTELDGILGGPNVHTFGAVVGGASTGNTLTIIIADTGDMAFDSTVYLAQLGGSNPGVIPEPLTMAGILAGIASIVGYVRRRAAA